MKLVLSAALATATLALALPASVAVAQDAHTIVAPDQIKWGPAPDVLPPGAEAAVLEELGVEIETKKEASRTPRQQRIIAGFEEIQRFVEQHGHIPQHGEDRDIFERLYAVRLDRLRQLADCRALLEPLDHQGLLTSAGPGSVSAPEELDDDEFLAQLGIDPTAADDITELRHVRSAAEKRAAEEIANRTVCEDFEIFKPLLAQVKKDLDVGVRSTRPFERMAEMKEGEFFIVGGQMAHVAEVGEEFISEYGRRDSRLRVIYDNGTESDVLLRSLQRALHRDEAGRRITNPSAGPLFSDKAEEGDLERVGPFTSCVTSRSIRLSQSIVRFCTRLA